VYWYYAYISSFDLFLLLEEAVGLLVIIILILPKMTDHVNDDMISDMIGCCFWDENHFETMSLLALTLISIIIPAFDPPFSDNTAASVVFGLLM
jgi:hypothetical protein